MIDLLQSILNGAWALRWVITFAVFAFVIAMWLNAVAERNLAWKDIRRLGARNAELAAENQRYRDILGDRYRATRKAGGSRAARRAVPRG